MIPDLDLSHLSAKLDLDDSQLTRVAVSNVIQHGLYLVYPSKDSICYNCHYKLGSAES